jgi:hypothetical protein
MASNNLDDTVYKLAEVVCPDPHPRLVGVAASDSHVGERPQVVSQGFERPGRHRGRVKLPETVGASIHTLVLLRQMFFGKMIRWSLCANGDLSRALLALAVLAICIGTADPTPTPTPVPLPF